MSSWASAFFVVAFGALAAAQDSQSTKKPTATARPPFREYFRVVSNRASRNDAGRWIIQASVRELRHPDTGCSLTLVAMSHLGQSQFYRALDRYVERAGIVLAEGDGGRLPGSPRLDAEKLPVQGRWIRRQYEVLARLLGLTHQYKWEARVVDERWVLADLQTEEMLAAMKAPGTTLLGPQETALVERLEKLAAGSPAEVTEGKGQAARWLWESFNNYPIHEGAKRNPLHVKREKRMFDVLKKTVQAGKHKRISFVQGAEHIYILEPKIVRELGFRHYATSWHDVYVLEAPAKKKPAGAAKD